MLVEVSLIASCANHGIQDVTAVPVEASQELFVGGVGKAVKILKHFVRDEDGHHLSPPFNFEWRAFPFGNDSGPSEQVGAMGSQTNARSRLIITCDEDDPSIFQRLANGGNGGGISGALLTFDVAHGTDANAGGCGKLFL